MEDVRQMLPPELTQMVRLGLPGVHEPGLELELSDEDLALYDGGKSQNHFILVLRMLRGT